MLRLRVRVMVMVRVMVRVNSAFPCTKRRDARCGKHHPASLFPEMCEVTQFQTETGSPS